MRASRRGNHRALKNLISAMLIFVPGLALASGDSWNATSTSGAPQGRDEHTAIWTGSKMVVWGGLNGAELLVAAISGDVGSSGALNTGGVYDSAANTWSPTSTTNAPAARDSHSAVWTGATMVVWGGENVADSKVYGDGGAYDPETNVWTPISNTNAPSARYGHTAVWTGAKMIVWGGWTKELTLFVGPEFNSAADAAAAVNSGAIYDPVLNSWTPISTLHAPAARGFQTAVWTGSKMIVWGGNDGTSNLNELNSGGIYDPATDTWTAMSLTNVPVGRDDHSAVWTGSKMIVWGGYGNTDADLNTGGVFDPVANSWIPTTITGAPAARSWHAAAWSGSKMIVWGGYTYTDHDVYYSNGGLYDPLTNSWSPMTTTLAPPARSNHTAVWTGSAAIFWGGYFMTASVSTGGVYSPAAAQCPAAGARNCVSPISAGTDARSKGRSFAPK